MASHLRNSPRQDRPTPHSKPSRICEVVGRGLARDDSAALAPQDETSRCRFVIARGKPRAMGRRVRRPYESKSVHAKTGLRPIRSRIASVKLKVGQSGAPTSLAITEPLP
ncbi:MAG: hypothetical protein JNJ88_01885 [Planctomycetes bacterium]|nr:hypothetical protein [Planctomycetota bacterium]